MREQTVSTSASLPHVSWSDCYYDGFMIIISAARIVTRVHKVGFLRRQASSCPCSCCCCCRYYCRVQSIQKSSLTKRVVHSGVQTRRGQSESVHTAQRASREVPRVAALPMRPRPRKARSAVNPNSGHFFASKWLNPASTGVKHLGCAPESQQYLAESILAVVWKHVGDISESAVLPNPAGVCRKQFGRCILVVPGWSREFSYFSYWYWYANSTRLY